MDGGKEYEVLALGNICHDKEFQRQFAYDSDGDCIEFVFSEEDFWAERVDSLVTVYYGRESKEIVGCLVKGVRSTIDRLSAKFPGFAVEVVDGRIRLDLLFSVGMWTADDVPPVERTYAYKKLRAEAQKTAAEVELCAN